MVNTPPTIRVAIIGAGPGGCMLARLLSISTKTDQISVTVFEAEASHDFRSQGGTLDLHGDSGMVAMRESGLHDEFLKHARYDGEALRACDKSLVTWLKLSGSGPQETPTIGEHPEIDRKELRRILVEGLPGGVIRWGWKLRKVDDDLFMHFENGMSEGGYDLIVGADGAWSKARALLSDQAPLYAGLGGHELTIPNAASTSPEIYKLVDRGSLLSFSDGKGILGQQLGSGDIMVYAWSVRSEDWMQTSGFDVRDGPQTKAAIAKEYNDWHPQLLNIPQSAGDKVTPRSFYMLPTGFRWAHRKGVTLIGDAAHLMTPFAGEGVNLAFVDALDLSRAIISSLENSDNSIDPNIVKFEDGMLKRSDRAQRETEANMKDMFFTPGAPRTIVERVICRVAKDNIHPVLYPFPAAVVYTGYFFYKRYVDLFL